MSEFRILEGDCIEQMRGLNDQCVQTVVTSPPYWGLRDYGAEGQLGLEPTPEEYVANLVAVFREVRRVLRDDGTLWLNLGDSYYGNPKGNPGDVGNIGKPQVACVEQAGAYTKGTPAGMRAAGIKMKDLVGIPWMVAFALRADGWYLRSDIIWSKPNPMPESVTDRPTKAHEYLFLLTKGPRYFYDASAIREDFADDRMGDPGQYRKTAAPDRSGFNTDRADLGFVGAGGGWKGGAENGGRNKRSVWTVATQPFSFQRGREHDKTYKASPDCPEHGPLADRERWQRAADGEPQAGRRYRIDSIDARRALARLDESDATNSPSNSDSRPTASARTSQSRAASKTPAPLTVSSPDECESPGSHTTRNRDGSESQRRSLDSLAPSGASTASGSSTESRRSAAQSERGGTACEELPDHTQYTGPSDVRLAPSGSDNPERSGKSVHTSRTCTCEESVLDHFATFPPKLIEPCILAGSRPRGAMIEPEVIATPLGERNGDDPSLRTGRAGMNRPRHPDEGTRSITVAEQRTYAEQLKASPHREAMASEAGEAFAHYLRTDTSGARPIPPDLLAAWIERGWLAEAVRPEAISADPSTATVLDPFNGAGTTGVVALRHDRDYIGIELNPEYAQMARHRITDDAPLLNVETT